MTNFSHFAFMRVWEVLVVLNSAWEGHPSNTVNPESEDTRLACNRLGTNQYSAELLEGVCLCKYVEKFCIPTATGHRRRFTMYLRCIKCHFQIFQR